MAVKAGNQGTRPTASAGTDMSVDRVKPAY